MRRLLKYDQFAAQVNLNYGPGVSSFQTSAGAILSLCTNLFGLIFLVLNTQMMLGYRSTLFTSSFQAKYFPLDHSISEA